MIEIKLTKNGGFGNTENYYEFEVVDTDKIRINGEEWVFDNEYKYYLKKNYTFE